MTFPNLFPIKKCPEKLIRTKITPIFSGQEDNDIQSDNIRYRAVGVIARNLSKESDPIASKGNYLISIRDIETKLVLNINFPTSFGLFKIAGFEIQSIELVDPSDPHWSKYVIPYLNRITDEKYLKKGYKQINRFYYDTDEDNPLGNIAIQHLGVEVRTVQYDENRFGLKIDFATSLESVKTVYDLIVEEKDLQEKETIYDIDPKQLKRIGRIYRKFRTTYQEYYEGEPYFPSYNFRNFDPTITINDSIDGNSPAQYQEERGRSFTPKEQPAIFCSPKMKGKSLTFIPSLLKPVISLKELRMIDSSLSISSQEYSQPEPVERYQFILNYCEFLLDDFIDYPELRALDQLSPINLILNPSIIQVNTDHDFRQVYSKKQVNKSPEKGKIILIYSETNQVEFDELSTKLIQTIKDFKISLEIVPKVFKTDYVVTGDAFTREYLSFIKQQSVDLDYKRDLILIIRPNRSKDIHSEIKSQLTIGKSLAVQFIYEKTINDNAGADFQKNLLNPLFTQMIMKLNGILATYSLESSLENTVVIGVDRYRVPGKVSVSAGAVAMSANGEFLGAFSPKMDGEADDKINLENILPNFLEFIKSRAEVKNVILLRDGGPGLENILGNEIEYFSSLMLEHGYQGSYVSVNKSNYWRIFEGSDPTDDNNVKRPIQYCGFMQFPHKNTFVAQTTAPPLKDRGTPRPLQYEIHSGDFSAITQSKLAKTVSAMTRIGTLSWKSTRLPLPLFYAHKLAQFVGNLGNTWPEPIDRPLFL